MLNNQRVHIYIYIYYINIFGIRYHKYPMSVYPAGAQGAFVLANGAPPWG